MIVIYEPRDFRSKINEKGDSVYSLRKEREPWEDYDFMLKAVDLETGQTLFRFENPAEDPYCDSFDHLEEILDCLVKNFDLYHDYSGYVYFEMNVDKGATYDMDAKVWEVKNGERKRDLTDEYAKFLELDSGAEFFLEYMKEMEEERDEICYEWK